MGKILKYSFFSLFVIILDIIIFFISPNVGDKNFFYNLIFYSIIIYIAFILYYENSPELRKRTKKLEAMFDYFDFDAIWQIISSKFKKQKNGRFDFVNSENKQKYTTVLNIKILEYERLYKLSREKRLRVMSDILDVVEEAISEKYGIIYEIKNGIITCVFNTMYELEESEKEVIETALMINISLMEIKEKYKNLNLAFNMSIIYELMDYFFKGKRILLLGDFKLADDIVNIEGEESIIITNKIFTKYKDELDTDYMGKFYFDDKEYKLHKVICTLEIEDTLMDYKTSKINIKKGKEKKLQKYAKTKNKY